MNHQQQATETKGEQALGETKISHRCPDIDVWLDWNAPDAQQMLFMKGDPLLLLLCRTNDGG
jgi:hypothetical protein